MGVFDLLVPLLQWMNEKLVLSQSEKEAMKCLTRKQAPSLKGLLSEDALVNVGLSLADPKGKAPSSPLFLFCLLLFVVFFFWSD